MVTTRSRATAAAAAATTASASSSTPSSSSSLELSPSVSKHATRVAPAKARAPDPRKSTAAAGPKGITKTKRKPKARKAAKPRLPTPSPSRSPTVLPSSPPLRAPIPLLSPIDDDEIPTTSTDLATNAPMSKRRTHQYGNPHARAHGRPYHSRLSGRSVTPEAPSSPAADVRLAQLQMLAGDRRGWRAVRRLVIRVDSLEELWAVLGGWEEDGDEWQGLVDVARETLPQFERALV
ncbi:hypothetical protein BDV95DRAFT_597242 [Massariosphaeria phaeospora]|uniref:Uncharacterized protein n=1 Tax=Massariosphaeria phaeospora TaxID=100035 RepID=A0A7C8M4D0_9PLEO|nr:hypothetical protein BDV95DRAFT_597242 [Massariosphaeria phaeospora]